MGWSCDGRKLASGSTDKTVSVFSLEKLNLVSQLMCLSTCLSMPYLRFTICRLVFTTTRATLIMLINWRGIRAIQTTWFQRLKTKLSEYGTLEVNQRASVNDWSPVLANMWLQQQNVLSVSSRKETISISVGVQMEIQLLLGIK